MSIINGRSRIFSVLLFAAVTAIGYAGHAQGITGEDPIGFKGGYKALSRLCETNLDGAARLLVNDYSRGYFISLEIPAGTDTITEISFLTATPAELAREIAGALKETNGKWMKRDRARKLLVPIFFCQNTPPNDSLFSQLLVANNAGFNVPGSPDQWPEAAEGVWIHPICRLVTGQARRAPASYTAPSGTAAAAASGQQTAIPPGQQAASTGVQQATAQQTQQAAPAASDLSAAVPEATANSGVYVTQADFDAGRMTYASQFPIEEKSLISWSPVNYVAYSSAVRVRISATGKDYKEFSSDNIFGFRSNGIKYIYLKSTKRYLPVLYKGSPFSLFMSAEKQTGIGDGTLYGVFLFAKTLDGPVKEFTRKRIDEEFGSNPKMTADLQTLRKEMDQHSMNMSPEGFRTCQQLAQSSLSKYAN